MAKRKKASKVQRRGKLRSANTATRGRVRRAKAAKWTKRTVAKAQPKRAPVKKAARRIKEPVAPVLESVAVEVVDQSTPDAIVVTETEEAEVGKAS